MKKNEEIIRKINRWRTAIEKYDEISCEAAEATLEFSETQFQENLEKKHLRFVKKMEKQHQVVDNLHSEAVILITEKIDDKELRTALITMLMTPPDFAGLEKKAFEAMTSPGADTKAILYAHQIYIEHSKMIANKIVRMLKS